MRRIDPSLCHFWQLYSLIGSEPIVDFVQDFYERIFADDEAEWFRSVFVKVARLDHHVATQAAYWIDAMGGGRCYHGGNYRLSFHHHHNASEIMTASGTKRWMYHMRRALSSYRKFTDPRIKPCIMDFLKTKMMTYAQEFEWDFDERDFEFNDEVVEKASRGRA
jgi:truncated hemoglobin YjbI